MSKGTGSNDFAPQQSEGVGRIYVVECYGPYLITGHLMRQGSLCWHPIPGSWRTYSQRLGRSIRHERDFRKHLPG
jgi:hypothetical protein